MIKFFGPVYTIFLFFILSGCQTAQETRTENTPNPNISVQPSKPETVALKPEKAKIIEVPKLADKSIGEFDRLFGQPEEAKSIDGGEYRLYKIANQPKGLAVRFFGGRAKSFNLIMDTPAPTSKEALKQAFGIDVRDARPLKDAKEPLTEYYQGVFDGVKFKKVSAKKQENGRGFIFVLAEVGE